MFIFISSDLRKYIVCIVVLASDFYYPSLAYAQNTGNVHACEELNTNFGTENVRLSLIFYPKIVHCNTKVFIQTVLPPRLGARFPFLIPSVTAVVISFNVPELVEFKEFGFVGSPLFLHLQPHTPSHFSRNHKC